MTKTPVTAADIARPTGLSPHLFRRARFDLFDYSGRWLGDTFADNARHAVEISAIGCRVAYAKAQG